MFSYKKVSIPKPEKVKMRNVAPFLKERGTDVRRWIVDTTLLGYRKAC